MVKKHADGRPKKLKQFSGGGSRGPPSSLGGYSIPPKSAPEGGASIRVA